MTDSVRLHGDTGARFVGTQMPSFRQVAAQSPILLLDAASSLVQVGVFGLNSDARWETSEEEAGVAIFQGVDKLQVDPSSVGAFVFCDGPGSVLGIRTAAMALRTWSVLAPRPIYSYLSLAVVAHALGEKEVAVIADARRETWHHYRIGEGLRRLEASALRGELIMPEHFRHWSNPPPNLRRVPYLLRDLLPQVWDADLLQATNAPDAFLHEEPTYVTWTPRVHQAR